MDHLRELVRIMDSEEAHLLILRTELDENMSRQNNILTFVAMGIFKASSGNEALSLLLRHRFAVVLLDVQMPEMDGF